MQAIELISQDLFDKVRSRFSNLEMGDEDGDVTIDPRAARFFDFDFVHEGHNLGRVSVSINERGSLKIFYTQGILEDQHPLIHQVWFKFLREMRYFSKQRLLRFDTRDITKRNLDKNDFRYLASTGTKEEVMAENRMYGSSMRSYLPLESARLIVKHHGPVDEHQMGSRSRNIKGLFIENSEGERFKYPFIHLPGAKAMLRHVANGGRPHDMHGQAIIGLSEEIAQLTALHKHTRNLHDSMQGGVNEIVERTSAKLQQLRDLMHQLSKQHHYDNWKNSYQPNNDHIILDQTTMEDYKNKFTVSSFSEDLVQFFPLIHRIMQETNTVNLDEYVGETKEKKCHKCNMPESKCRCETAKEVKEFAEFNEWTSKIAEGHLPDDMIHQLEEILNNTKEVGPDGTAGLEALDSIELHDDELEQMIKDAAPLGELKTVVSMWLKKKGDTQALHDLKLDMPDHKTANSPSMPKSTEPEEPESSEETPPEETPPPEAGAAPPEPGTTPPAEDDEPNDENKPKLKGSPEYLVRQLVKGFFNREDGTWTIGRPAIVTKVEKQFGEKMVKYAKAYIIHLSKKAKQHHETTQAFEDILRLSGLKK